MSFQDPSCSNCGLLIYLINSTRRETNGAKGVKFVTHFVISRILVSAKYCPPLTIPNKGTEKNLKAQRPVLELALVLVVNAVKLD